MAYKWITKYNSPNYTPANRVQATWGRPRKIEAIAIHWWGDPKKKPSFKGVVNWLCNSASGASAHIVATGTNREVACLVDLNNASWATNSANPYTISIECDPRCRSEDYDVVAEVIAQLRSIYGNLPLVPHKKFSATACPGNYDLARLNKLAGTKKVSKSSAWGKVTNKTVITTKTETKKTAIKFAKNTEDHPGLEKGETVLKTKGVDGERTVVYTVTYTNGKETKRVVKSDKVTKAPVDELVLVGSYEKPPEGGFSEDDRNTLNNIQKLLEWLINAFKAIFRI